jgi:hypothetical protein
MSFEEFMDPSEKVQKPPSSTPLSHPSLSKRCRRPWPVRRMRDKEVVLRTQCNPSLKHGRLLTRQGEQETNACQQWH